MAEDTRTGELADSELAIERWRDELQLFGRQTSAQLQQILGAIEGAQARAAQRPMPPISPPVADSRPPVSLSRRPPSETDEPQDRLANLKRILAAKLSNGETGQDGGGTPG